MKQLSLPLLEDAACVGKPVEWQKAGDETADKTQRQATDPKASVWVGASAGTGKTKVLTDRALRLMLNGTRPERILCLTFTKAAAAEMESRINFELGLWAKTPEFELQAALVRLLGRPADELELHRARTLFPAVLDAPGGLKVLTIHAFCQSLLGRFPLEAGLAPHFSVMNERDTVEALAAACETLLVQVQSPADPLAQAFALVGAHLQESAFRTLIKTLAGHRGRLALALRHYGSATAAASALRRHLGIGSDETTARLMADACDESAFDGSALRAAAEALLTGGKKDRERGAVVAEWLAADSARRVEIFDAYCRVFLTKKEKVRAILMSKACAGNTCDAAKALCAEGQRLVSFAARRRSAACADTSAAVLNLADALISAYTRYKDLHACLDYEDLIERAADLLEQEGAAWVLFKLDGGIDHVLVDEAQDTSPEQWRIVRAMTAEFFSRAGSGSATRTVFAVGDVKQSIFSFQGADPALFLENGRHFAEDVVTAGQSWREVKLSVSFRSTRAVLAAVDAVFSMDDNSDGVALEGEPIEHAVSAGRAGDGGLVELWPPLKAQREDMPEPWRPPVEQTPSDSPRRRLAWVVARRIRAMLDGNTRLESKGRPVRPEDILVLVRRRKAFVEELVRALKSLGVPIAGVDRMELSKQIAVMDLVALGRFVLLPEDDLTLACVLKSPLIGFDDDDLFDLAFARKGSLWRALQHQQRMKGARYDEAVSLLSELLNTADSMPPFEFYMRVLGPLGGRARLLARLGQDADDPIAEFLDLAMAYERRHPPSLEGFLHWLETGETVVKRDLEQAAAAVRIMTVHGAKGLQAPIVFLPDTMGIPGSSAQSSPGQLVWPVLNDGVAVPLWAPSVGACDEVALGERERLKIEVMREYRRLLYVAMTRAEDRLIVCGWRGKKAEPNACWYNAIRRGLEYAAAKTGGVEILHDPALDQDPDFDAEPTILRLCHPQERLVEKTEDVAVIATTPLPEWVRTPAAAAASAELPLIPSRAEGASAPVRSAVAAESAGLTRGRLIHRLLQRLPDLEPGRRRPTAAAWLAQPDLRLEPHLQETMLDEAMAVLDHPDHASLFAAGSLAEVPISGMIGTRPIVAQVDRLVVTEDSVTIVDYKNDRPAPNRPEQVAATYFAQMAAYRAALRLIYPQHAVRCALLWIEGPRLMVLPDGLLDRHAP
ncbi:MAG: double-strand break repair helicase AddA [Rhodospirillales bacterium]|nr:double-strand break repair helicase AddA [Rhodospirillales bacterium]